VQGDAAEKSARVASGANGEEPAAEMAEASEEAAAEAAVQGAEGASACTQEREEEWHCSPTQHCRQPACLPAQ